LACVVALPLPVEIIPGNLEDHFLGDHLKPAIRGHFKGTSALLVDALEPQRSGSGIKQIRL
jgi:hypothetical protein